MNRFHRWYCRSDLWRQRAQGELVPWVLKGVDLGDELLEIGPGPGVTTDVLAAAAKRLTAVEIDPQLAESLQRRKRGSNVRVIQGDATRLPFPDGAFSGAVSFTMLHHVPSAALQDRLLAETRRVLRPGGVFAGSDSRTSLFFRAAHLFDTMVLVDPSSFAARLERAGFRNVDVKPVAEAFRFRAVA